MVTSTLENPKVERARLVHFGGATRLASDREAHNRIAPLLEAAVTKLAAFQTADDLAAFLEAEGIQGETGLSDRCAAARWLQKETGIPGLRVASTIAVRHELATTTIFAPDVIREFYNHFDRGGYPRLHKRGPRGEIL